MKDRFLIIIVSIVSLLIGMLISFLLLNTDSSLVSLPKPEVTGGERGQLGIDKNINEETIDNYLNRSDSVYRDMRMLVDPGNYAVIGGDSYLSGLVSGFEVVPYPLLTEVKGLPEAVGDSYKGKTLFKLAKGEKVIVVTSVEAILRKYIPKKVLLDNVITYKVGDVVDKGDVLATIYYNKKNPEVLVDKIFKID